MNESAEVHAVASVWQAYEEALTAVRALAPGEDGESAPASVRGGPLRVRSDLELEDMPALQWLAEAILPLGSLSAIYGAPGAGKSFVAVDLAFSLATGRAWLGRPVLAGGALIIAGEGLHGLGQRVVAWKAAANVLGQSVGVGLVSDGVDLLNPADVSRICYAAEAPQLCSPTRLIILDTLARSMTGDENSTQDMGRVITAADRIRRATGAAVMLVHHTRKDSDQERGNTALRGAVDTLLYCEEGDEGRTLTCQKQKDAPFFEPIPFRLLAGHGSCIVQASGNTEQHPEDAREHAELLTPKRLAVLRSLSEGFTTRGATTAEWTKASNLPERTFYRVRTWLVGSGLVSETARGGRYQLTDSGRSALGSHKMSAATAAKLLPNQLPPGSVFFDKKTETPPSGSSAGSGSGSMNGSNPNLFEGHGS